ncbi:MAG: stage III sporulation AC/AD family protein [Clostridia bacterium]|nr:stage III sporulation AC/AD family protein [Clostridia bacterium]
MNDLLPYIGAALVCTVASLVLRSLGSPLYRAVPVAAACLFIPAGLKLLNGLFSLVGELKNNEALSDALAVILKALAVGLAVSAVAAVCRDLGEPGVAEKLEFWGNCAVAALAVPLVRQILELAVSFIP